MDHGRQPKDGASLVRAGSEAVCICSDRSPISYHYFASSLTDVVVAFLEFALHVVSQQERAHQVPGDEPWKHSDRYIRWFYRYPILLSSTLLQSLTLSCRDLATRIFLFTRSGPDILPIHCRSLAASEAEWSMRWRF